MTEGVLDEDEALAAFHAQLTMLSRYSFNTRQLESWDVYERLLNDDIDDAPRENLLALWSRAHREFERHGQIEPRQYVAEVPTAMYEIEAASAVEFIELLRMLIIRSGVTTHQVAGRAPSDGLGKLNSSQLYAVLDRGTLPRSAAQMRSFGEACGLDEHRTQQLLRVWATLRQAQQHAKRVRSTKRAEPAAALRHRPRHSSTEDDSRTRVEKWFDRADRVRRARSGWAPAEPTSASAAREAVVMTRHLREAFG